MENVALAAFTIYYVLVHRPHKLPLFQQAYTPRKLSLSRSEISVQFHVKSDFSEAPSQSAE